MGNRVAILFAFVLASCSQGPAASVRQVETISLSERAQRPLSYTVNYEIQCKHKIVVTLFHRLSVDPDFAISGISLAGRQVRQSDLQAINMRLSNAGTFQSMFVPECGWINSSGSVELVVRTVGPDPSEAALQSTLLELSFDEAGQLVGIRD